MPPGKNMPFSGDVETFFFRIINRVILEFGMKDKNVPLLPPSCDNRGFFFETWRVCRDNYFYLL